MPVRNKPRRKLDSNLKNASWAIVVNEKQFEFPSEESEPKPPTYHLRESDLHTRLMKKIVGLYICGRPQQV